ncbi:unnamed protein product [Closterium sp. Yama58-4]|nr:unnamed protein product [Closterium sp. Yama58-4]
MDIRKVQIEQWIDRAKIPLIAGHYGFGEVCVLNWRSDEDEADAEKKIEEALIEPLPSESDWLASNPEAPAEAARSSGVKCSSSLVSFRHALVCKRWLRVSRLVHPAIVVPLDRFFSARALASLLRAPATAGFPNLRHLHLAPNALDTVDSALVRAICVGSGPSLSHLTLQLHDA